jgi:CheY-like chemotaxis protein
MSVRLQDDLRVTPHVLVVDDDQRFRGIASRLLAALDLGEVVEACTVASALEVAARLQPVAALVDAGLPDGDGVELAARLAAAPWSPRVVLTSSDLGVGARAGVIPFIAKDQLADGALRSRLSGASE